MRNICLFNRVSLLIAVLLVTCQPLYASETSTTAALAANSDHSDKKQKTTEANPQKASPPHDSTSPDHPINVADIGGALYSEYNIASPLFWISQGQVFARSAVGSTHSSIYNSRIGGYVKSNQTLLEQVVRYGFTDDISLQAIFDYEPYDHKVSQISSTKSRGWDNPTFDVIGRLFVQPQNPLFMYVNLSYSPNLLPAVQAQPGHYGTLASGQQSVALQDYIGYQLSQYTFEVTATAQYNSEGNGTGYSWAEELNLELFDFVSDRWSYEINSGISFSPSKGSHPGTYAVGEVDYYLVPSKVQAQLVYRHDFVGDQLKNGNNPATRVLLSHRQSDSVQVRLGYLFDSAQ